MTCGIIIKDVTVWAFGSLCNVMDRFAVVFVSAFTHDFATDLTFSVAPTGVASQPVAQSVNSWRHHRPCTFPHPAI